MATSVGVPAICAAHGGTTSVLPRIGWIADANGWHTVLTPATSFDVAVAEELVGNIGQGMPLLVFHLISTGDDADLDIDTLREERDRIDGLLRSTYPGIGVRSWVVALTGHRLEPHEIEGLATLRPGSRGVVATAASTSTSVAHKPEDEVAFAANIVAVLGTSTLEGDIAAVDTTWLASASSVTYSRSILELAAAAMFIRSHLASILNDTEGDEASDIGFTFLDDLGLGTQEKVDSLLNTGAGGSLRSRVRFGELDFDEIPVEAWSETILGHYDMVVMHEMPLIKERIVHNAAATLDDLKDGIRRKLLDDFEDTGNLAASVDFCEGMYRSLGQTLHNLKTTSPDAPTYDVDEDRRKLRRLTRWLPIGPAVAVRLLAAALLTLILGASLTDGAQVPINFVASKWSVAAAAVLLVLGWALYRRRYRRTVRVRDRLRDGIEEGLVHDVNDAALDAWIVMLESLRAWIGAPTSESPDSATKIPEHADSITNWFRHLASLLRSIDDEVRERDEDRLLRNLGSTEYALNVPTADAIPTRALIAEGTQPTRDDVVRGLVLMIRPQLLDDALPIPLLDTFVDEWTATLEVAIAPTWNSLDDLLSSDETTLTDARTALSTNLTPTGGTSPDVRHYLVTPGGKQGKAGDAITPSADMVAEGVMSSLDAVLPTTAPNFAAMLHLYRLENTPEEDPS